MKKLKIHPSFKVSEEEEQQFNRIKKLVNADKYVSAGYRTPRYRYTPLGRIEIRKD